MALKGRNNEEKIWNFFKSKEFNDYACAGIIGNLYAESGLKSNNLQDTGNRKLGMTDDEYVAAIDNGTYTKNQFIYDGQGAFLAQWTFWSRKKAIYEFAKSKNVSIGNLEMQLEFLYKELTEDFKSVFNKLKTATSVSEASNVMLLEFEKPANQSKLVQAKRAAYSQKYYDKYATNSKNTTTTNNSSAVSAFKMRTTKPEAGNKYYITKANGGWSNAIQGSPKDEDCDTLSNCVGYSYSRFNEIGGYGYCKYLTPVNAERFIECKNPELQVGQTPKLGACMVWKGGSTLKGADGAGHVAIVEKVISDTEVYTSESGWGSVTPFWNQTRKKGENGRWGMGSSYTFLGFIYNPAVTNDTKVDNPIVSKSVVPTVDSASKLKVESAKSFSKSVSGTYQTVARLNMRSGAGTNKAILVVVPKGGKVTCYGYYTVANGIKWYYVIYKNNQGVEYTGFVSSEYVKK